MADNARFHNKLHRRNHHSVSSPGYPDSGTDPIASTDEPFQGNMVVNATVSAQDLWINRDAFIGRDVTIVGNLSVYGEDSYFETFVTATSSMSVINHGFGPALTVKQTGPEPIARFLDGDAIGSENALLIADTGQIVINDNRPTLDRRVTISGSITASGNTEFQAGSAGSYRSFAANSGLAIGPDTASFGTSIARGPESVAFNTGFTTGRRSFAAGQSTTATGSGSFVHGIDNLASGDFGHAEGSQTIAGGYGSHTEGEETGALGDFTHAEGQNTRATGWHSHAEGNTTTSDGIFTHTEGELTSAFGPNSHAEGFGTASRGGWSHAEGIWTDARASYSHAEGQETHTRATGSHAEGLYTSATGNFSHVEGVSSITVGQFSHAEGRGTIAYGDASHTEGSLTSAYGVHGHAEGEQTLALSAAHAEGRFTAASGAYTHAEGLITLAYGIASHAEGAYTKSLGQASHAEGAFTRTEGEASHAEGLSSIAIGTFSHAEGLRTRALGHTSHASGNSTVSEGEGSFTYGWQTTASGIYSMAGGAQTHAGAIASQAVGYLTTTGPDASGSLAVGIQTTALGAGSFTLGWQTTAGGDYSYAEGIKTWAEGFNSYSLGLSSRTRDYSYAYANNPGVNTWVRNTKTHQYMISSLNGVYIPGYVGIGTDSDQNSLTVTGTISSHVLVAYSTNSNQVTANNIYGYCDETVFTDGVNLSGNGNQTLTMNYTNGIYVSSAPFHFTLQNSAANAVIFGRDPLVNLYRAGNGVLRTDGNMTIMGNLSVNGDLTYLDTIVSITSALSVVNTGTGAALTVVQTGIEPIARFIDRDAPTIDQQQALFVENNGNIGMGTAQVSDKLNVRGNTNMFRLTAAASTFYTLTSQGISGISTDSEHHLIRGRMGMNTQGVPITSYALHIRGGNIRVDGVDYSWRPGFNGAAGGFDTDGQSLFDLRSATPASNYNLSIASSGVNHFMKFFGGRVGDPNPFIVVKTGDPLRFASFNNFYNFPATFVEHMRIDTQNSRIGIGTQTPNAKLTVVGTISSNSWLSAGNIDLQQADVRTFVNPATATGDFLVLNINGTNRALRLWDFTN